MPTAQKNEHQLCGARKQDAEHQLKSSVLKKIHTNDNMLKDFRVHLTKHLKKRKKRGRQDNHSSLIKAKIFNRFPLKYLILNI